VGSTSTIATATSDRAKVMWAIRTAYTHGNGHISQITDPEVAKYLAPSFARKHFRGVKIVDDILNVTGDVTYPALKTALEINDRFGAWLSGNASNEKAAAPA